MMDPRRLPPPLPDGRGSVLSTNAWKSNLSRCRFRQAAVTETSVHNAVQPVTHVRGTCSGERSMNADHETTRRWLPSSVCRSDCGAACPGQPSCLTRGSAQARKATTDVLLTLSVGPVNDRHLRARGLSTVAVLGSCSPPVNTQAPAARISSSTARTLSSPSRARRGRRVSVWRVDAEHVLLHGRAPLFSAGAAAGRIDGCPRPIGRDSHGSSPYPVRRWPSGRLWS
jgi:hypothetical protein